MFRPVLETSAEIEMSLLLDQQTHGTVKAITSIFFCRRIPEMLKVYIDPPTVRCGVEKYLWSQPPQIPKILRTDTPFQQVDSEPFVVQVNVVKRILDVLFYPLPILRIPRGFRASAPEYF